MGVASIYFGPPQRPRWRCLSEAANLSSLVRANIRVARPVALKPFVNQDSHEAGAVAHLALRPGNAQAAHELKRGVVRTNTKRAAFVTSQVGTEPEPLRGL